MRHLPWLALCLPLLLVVEAGSQDPTPAPVVTPDPISTPLATIDGAVTSRGMLKVYVTLPPASDDVRVTWGNDFPPNAPEPDVLQLKDGRELWLWDDPAQGEYHFHLRVQRKLPEWDGLEFVDFSIDVGTPAPPVDPTPQPEPDTETNPSLLKLTALLKPYPEAAAEMRDLYASMAEQVRNDTAGGLKTVGDFRGWQLRTERAAFDGKPITKVAGIAGAIGGFVDPELGLDATKPLDHAKAAAVLDRLSKACGKAVK